MGEQEKMNPECLTPATQTDPTAERIGRWNRRRKLERGWTASLRFLGLGSWVLVLSSWFLVSVAAVLKIAAQHGKRAKDKVLRTKI